MRKFTKEHNDLSWLYPSLYPNEPWDDPEDDYDEYENIGISLLQAAHGQGMNIGQGGDPRENLYTADDLMDAFMKGTSVAQQILLQNIDGKIEYETNKRLLERSKNVEEQLKIALKLIEDLKKDKE